MTAGTDTDLVALADLTATGLLERFARGDATPVEAVRSCLASIERTDGELNAVRLLRADEAEAEAETAAARWADGTARPLEGVPFGLKDIIATAGVATTGGSALYDELVPAESARTPSAWSTPAPSCWPSSRPSSSPAADPTTGPPARSATRGTPSAPPADRRRGRARRWQPT